MHTEYVVDDNEVAVLRVSSSSAPQSVAAAISKSIYESHRYPILRAIGHGAVGQTVKALAIARGYVAPRGTDLAFVVGFDTIINDEGKEISAMVFKTFAR
jgi:stage V sporulation protein S